MKATVHPIGAASSRPLVIRRNRGNRLAGVGYAAISLLWLGFVARTGLQAATMIPTLILAVFTGVGLGLALTRDDLSFDSDNGRVVHHHGLAGLSRSTVYRFEEFDALVVSEGVAHRPYSEEPGRSWSALALSDSRTGRTLDVIALNSEDPTPEKLRADIVAQASSISRLTGLPIKEPRGAGNACLI